MAVSALQSSAGHPTAHGNVRKHIGRAKIEDELGCGQTSSWQRLWLSWMWAASSPLLQERLGSWQRLCEITSTGRQSREKKDATGMLTMEEETALVKWMLEMQNHGHPISIFELRRKVAEITQERWTPFTDGIPRRGWLKWFRNRHPELTLRSAQGLEEGHARGLNPSSVASLYENLQRAYEEHSYSPSHIWNADESGAQVGRNGGSTLVFAR